jgi:hypothetical protein
MVKIEVMVFWVVAPCSVVAGCQCFWRTMLSPSSGLKCIVYKSGYMRGIQKVRTIYYFLYSTKGTQEQMYCHFFDIILKLSDVICEECFLLCMMPQCTKCLASFLQTDVHVMHLRTVQKYGNQMGQDLDCNTGRGGSLNFSFQIVSMVTAAV